MRRSVSCASLALILLLPACATIPATRVDGRPRCDVWQTGMLGDTVVSVDRGVATSYAMFERDVARLNSDGSISSLGLFEITRAHVEGNRLRIEGLFGDRVSEPIGAGRVVLPGVLVDDEYHYLSTCSVAEAALGAFALHLLAEEAAQDQSRTK